jgi:hypothetical protein
MVIMIAEVFRFAVPFLSYLQNRSELGSSGDLGGFVSV